MKAEKTYISVGKIASTYGIHGHLKVKSYTESGPSILDYQPWYLTYGPHVREVVKIEAGKKHGESIIVKIPGFNTPESARLFTGALIEVKRETLPALSNNHYYWSDLIGLSVMTIHGESLGQVAYLIETGANDVLVVKAEKEIAIPYLLDEVIKKIDLEKQQIVVDWEQR